MKTDIEIKDNVYSWIKTLPIVQIVSGKLCTRLRPLNSDKEDIVISILANNFAQRQQSFINVNIYIKDVKIEGRNEENTKRLREISRMAYDQMKCLNNDFRITLNEQRILEVEAIGYHVINNKLLYEYIDED